MIIVEDKTTSDDETVMADIDVRSTYNVEDSEVFLKFEIIRILICKKFLGPN